MLDHHTHKVDTPPTCPLRDEVGGKKRKVSIWVIQIENFIIREKQTHAGKALPDDETEGFPKSCGVAYCET
jgi:hypothetical protein